MYDVSTSVFVKTVVFTDGAVYFGRYVGEFRRTSVPLSSGGAVRHTVQSATLKVEKTGFSQTLLPT